MRWRRLENALEFRFGAGSFGFAVGGLPSASALKFEALGATPRRGRARRLATINALQSDATPPGEPYHVSIGVGDVRPVVFWVGKAPREGEKKAWDPQTPFKWPPAIRRYGEQDVVVV